MSKGQLDGQRILVTRRPEQSMRLVEHLRAAGALVRELPTIVVAAPEDPAPLDEALRRLAEYRFLVLTSGNAVEAIRARLDELGLTARGPRPEVASVGPSTTRVCRHALPDLPVAVEPELEFRAEGLLLAFDGLDVKGESCLLPVSDRARETLAEGLRSRGARVDVRVAYRTLAPPDLEARFAAVVAEGIDLAVFASPSAVQNLLEAAGKGLRGLPAAVIGPVTEVAARQAGLDVQVVASPSTTDGLIAGLLALKGRSE